MKPWAGAQSPQQKLIFVDSGQNLRKSRYQSFLVLFRLICFYYFWKGIFWLIANLQLERRGTQNYQIFIYYKFLTEICSQEIAKFTRKHLYRRLTFNIFIKLQAIDLQRYLKETSALCDIFQKMFFMDYQWVAVSVLGKSNDLSSPKTFAVFSN